MRHVGKAGPWPSSLQPAPSLYTRGFFWHHRASRAHASKLHPYSPKQLPFGPGGLCISSTAWPRPWKQDQGHLSREFWAQRTQSMVWEVQASYEHIPLTHSVLILVGEEGLKESQSGPLRYSAQFSAPLAHISTLMLSLLSGMLCLSGRSLLIPEDTAQKLYHMGGSPWHPSQCTRQGTRPWGKKRGVRHS